MDATDDDPQPPIQERSVPLPIEDNGPPSLEDSVCYFNIYFTGPSGSIGRVSPLGNGISRVRDIPVIRNGNSASLLGTHRLEIGLVDPVSE